jgi:hypothetical protein
LIAELQAEPETVKDFLRNAAKKLLGLKRLDELIHVRIQEPDAQVVSALIIIAAGA